MDLLHDFLSHDLTVFGWTFYVTNLKNFRLDLVFSGHVHAYERSKPVKNVQHFVVGHAGNNEAGPR